MMLKTLPLLVAMATTSFMASTTVVTAQATTRTFVDDRGKSFEISGKPKIAVRAGVGGVTLFDMGMKADQLYAIWGLWGIRGSDFDPDAPEKGSIYDDQDPGTEEAAFLSSAVNWSPSCYKNPRGCFRPDNITEAIQQRDNFDYILQIDNNGFNLLEAEEAGMNVIYIDTFYDFNPNCRFANMSLPEDRTACYGRSMIDIAQRIEELAIALGVDVDGAELEKQKEEACNAAAKFTDTMESVQEKGVRVKVSIVGFRDDPDKPGEEYFYVRDFDPTNLWIPRTLEELGMPLLHGGKFPEGTRTEVSADDYFIDCPKGEVSESCNGATYFPVDFWMIDSRSYRLIEDPSIIEKVFPDKAILKGQMWQYARNDGSLSFKQITSMLTELAKRLATAEVLQEKTACKSVDPKSVDIIGVGGGLDLNEYICYNKELIQKEYTKCATTPADSSGGVMSLAFSTLFFANMMMFLTYHLIM